MAKKRARRIIIVSNRLPIKAGRAGAKSTWEASPGGLVTAMKPVLEKRSGAWVGWTGAVGPMPTRLERDGLSLRPVPLSAPEVEAFYRGQSNRTFWPLYHDAIREPEFHDHWWKPYVEVNKRFARAAANRAGPRDVVWVHDYHLQLVPKMLREMRPDLKIGFFLHIPFPPEELFDWLPWRREVLEGLLGADVVGFQTHPAVRNFSRLAQRHTTAEGTDTELRFEGRRVRVGSFPISIDYQDWERTASSPETARKAAELRQRVGPRRKILLAVDRLDYTKGIDQRLLAYEDLLRQRKTSARECVLVQIAVPGRDDVSDYARLRSTIERTVGKINGEFSELGQVAVHYLRRSLARKDLAAYYRAADVMLVTPMRDGMNLVAKEYVASQVDGYGVLVLSEFAGAAGELKRSLLVNPRNREQMVSQVHAAMTMPGDEARARMASLRATVRKHDVHQWAGEFLEALA
ncbi:MAG: trehalose-6-phosphate synthase [Phycisphaeraceae bacterium]|nr:trehalose-6-phosphate synthase [Phycisphaeraceae bacterium]